MTILERNSNTHQVEIFRLADPARAVKWLRRYLCQNVLRTAILLSLLLVVMHGYSTPLFTALLALALPILIFFPKTLETPWPWMFLTGAACLAIYQNWYLEDNHKILLAYWLFTMTLVFFLRESEREFVLVKSARFFLVFVFGAAAIQKSLDPTYISSDFFAFTLLTDQRFETLMALIGVAREDLALSRAAKIALEQGNLADNAIDTVMLVNSVRVNVIAFLVTWWDLLVQVVIAILLAVNRRNTDLLAHIALIGFIATTYFFAPVIGFGWTITIWAFLISARRFPHLALVYLSILQLLSIYQLPWGTLLARVAA